ncbi:hypothetical protein COCMIDRAFT_29550 [Bipolaris oryzae ATCC 44560]|uniref:SGNH hydrolase-type esterase domain-containing protein n=1 Tax=Bipolaris oryzae ATCC 44560 TaxID=930090 RepID=W6YW17_COCMI|nr:uncharacterized protein COCMIDRAFT_29550 [Bipolaris oryzae ATCC 44560]EUC41733.1 hypothetical protein COCMIDRAFT_29550 [Bipolaris oryzae ATCC 44560]
MASETDEASKIDSGKFYNEYKGHPIADLTIFRNITLTEHPDKPIIYLAGDSSLDNKFWLKERISSSSQIPAIYHYTLATPITLIPDVAYWLNSALSTRATCINTAVEESLLRSRDTDLLPHDAFIRSSIRANDILVVSVGSNDIALNPSVETSAHMFQLAWLTPRKSIEDGSAWGLPYFRNLFGTKIQEYIARLTEVTKPRTVVVCMIYFPLESGKGQSGWADGKLRVLGYERDPGQLQAAIRELYKSATEEIKVEGVQVVPCALFEVLDGKGAGDYVERVEPSGEGGRKMAGEFVRVLEGVLGEGVGMENE